MRRADYLHDICVLTYTHAHTGLPPAYRAKIGGVFRGYGHAWLMAGRLSWLACVRSIEVWAMIGGTEHRQTMCWQRPTLDEWWATEEGEYEAAYAHEIELCRCLKNEGLELSDHVYPDAAALLMWNREDLERWGMSYTTRGSSASSAEGGRSDDQPGILIV